MGHSVQGPATTLLLSSSSLPKTLEPRGLKSPPLSRRPNPRSGKMASSNQTVLQFAPSPESLSAKVHPLVIFNICDCYVRRPDQAERVIGTLLGSVLPDGTVDVRNSYAVPHNESSDQVCFSALLAFSRLTLICLSRKNWRRFRENSINKEMGFKFTIQSFSPPPRICFIQWIQLKN